MSNAVCLFTFSSIRAHKALKDLRYIVVRLSAAVIVSKLSASRGCLAPQSLVCLDFPFAFLSSLRCKVHAVALFCFGPLGAV